MIRVALVRKRSGNSLAGACSAASGNSSQGDSFVPTKLRGERPVVRPQSLLLGLFVVVLGLYVAWKSAQQPAPQPEPAPT
jgi:hypothetical protein